MKKKVALSLSVNAIVVLILAIVMLGLGLGFMRGMFGKVTTQFEEQVATEPEPPAPSGSEPITLSRESIVTRAKETKVVKVAVYNPSDQDWGANDFKINTTCSSGPGVPLISNSVNMRDINQGESETFNILMKVYSAATPKTY